MIRREIMEQSGNLLSRPQVMSLLGKGIKITPFDKERLKHPWYALYPYRIWSDLQHKLDKTHTGVIELDHESYELGPKEYAEVIIEERIILSEGIVGLFIPASFSIEQGILITAGKLDSNYSAAIKFGVFNAKWHPVGIYRSIPIVYIAFFQTNDFEESHPASYDPYDKMILKIRGTDDRAEVIDAMTEFINELKKK
jgi:hypothetical protein